MGVTPDTPPGGAPGDRASTLSEAQLAELVAVAADAIITADVEQRITFFNEGAEAIFGYRAGEILGRPLDVLIPERLRAQHRGHVARFRASPEQARRMGERMGIAGVRKGGEEFAAEASILKLDGSGGPVVAVVLRDVSEQQRSQVAVQKGEEQFRLLVDAVRDYAIFKLDPDGRVASWNTGAQLIKGYTADEIIGQHFSKFYPADVVARGWPQTELERAAADGRFEDEGWRLRKDGTRFWANVVITALRDPAGRLVGFGKVTRDLTERLRTEEQARELIREQAARAAAEQVTVQLRENEAHLESLAIELEHTIEELQARTAEEQAARAEAEKARRLAEEASQAKSQFLAVMSHELRTPLNVVLGFVDLLTAELAGPLTQPQRDHLQRIQASAWHLLELINRVLSLSRIEAGKEEVELEEADVSAIARECAALIEPAALKKGLALDVELAEAPLVARTDVGKLRQILLNLLNNAVKYTDEGSVSLRLGTEDEWICIDVRDSGIGIAPEQLERIFEPFTQVEPSSSRGRGGTGLGLSVTRELVRLLGGRVEVESEAGLGTRFRVRLPGPGTPLTEAPQGDVP